jgi:SAM-dependent methyltransferase
MAVSFASQVVQGKTLGRALFNMLVERHTQKLTGRVLDLAGGGSYEALLPRGIELVRTNLDPQKGALVDFNRPLPYADASFDHVLLFNALYIAEDPPALMREVRRVLASGGSALVSSPYLQNEMREPHDYTRLTSEGLDRLFKQAGFARAVIEPFGERFSVAANLLHPFWLVWPVRLAVYSLARVLDRVVPAKIRILHPAPLGYFCVLYP